MHRRTDPCYRVRRLTALLVGHAHGFHRGSNSHQRRSMGGSDPVVHFMLRADILVRAEDYPLYVMKRKGVSLYNILIKC